MLFRVYIGLLVMTSARDLLVRDIWTTMIPNRSIQLKVDELELDPCEGYLIFEASEIKKTQPKCFRNKSNDLGIPVKGSSFPSNSRETYPLNLA